MRLEGNFMKCLFASAFNPALIMVIKVPFNYFFAIIFTSHLAITMDNYALSLMSPYVGNYNRLSITAVFIHFYLPEVIIMPKDFQTAMLSHSRLWLPLALTLVCYVALMPYASNGPLAPAIIDNIENCKSSWWATLTFVNNFVHIDKTVSCSPHP